MSQKFSFFQRAWDILHFLLCLVVVGLLLIYLMRELRHGTAPLETAEATAQVTDEPVVANASVVVEASTVSVASDTPVALEVPGVSVASNAPIALDVPGVSVASNAPIALDVPAVSVASNAPIALDVSSVSVTSDAPVALNVPGVSVVSDAPVVFEVPAVSVVSSAPVVLEAPAAPDEPVVVEEPVVPDVHVAELKSIAIRPDSPVVQRLNLITVKRTETTDPIVPVTGVNVASLQQSKAHDIENALLNADKQPDFKFHVPELLTAFTDRQKALDDIAFAEKQLQLVEEHFQTIMDALKQKIALLEEEVKGGMEAKKTLDDARTDLSKAEFEWKKELLAAQAALQHAQRDKAMYEKQLELAGFQQELLASSPRDIDILMAEVPESMAKHVQAGQQCVAGFLNHPGKTFHGKVYSVVPVLSKESPSLRVLFAVEDAEDVLHTGMLAEIGLGVEPRLVLRVPSEAVVTIDDTNYVLVRKSEAEWNVTEVRIGEQCESGVEIFSGLKDGDRIVGNGARLFKPVIAESLQLR
ncbi:MAG: efflux RND transporter periplasmic adaptor subunit [Planctomycetaceae bacterium]|nr:efflux RND transporter periplasmic adaptor subunit [Planctomycetaceae bacterium]